MRRFVIGVLAVIGALTVLALVVSGALIASFVTGRPGLPDKIVLTTDLTQGLAEGPGEGGLEALIAGRQPTLRDFLDALDRAQNDPRVTGLFARIGDGSLGLAKIQEARDAIAAFRRHGKFAVAFADSFGGFGPGTRAYYLATAFDRIWLQPMGSVGLVGLYANPFFFKGTLDLLGIAARFDHREQYKTAMNLLTET